MSSFETELGFLVREDSLHKTISPPLEHRFQTLDIHEINAHAEDHIGKCLKCTKMPKVPKVEKREYRRQKTESKNKTEKRITKTRNDESTKQTRLKLENRVTSDELGVTS